MINEDIIYLENIYKQYPNGFEALKNINLKIKKGEFIAIIGLSGSGKSTLLRIINKLINPTKGKVHLYNQNITDFKGKKLRGIRSQIGMIFQQHNLIKRASVITNVLTGQLGILPTYRAFFNSFPQKSYDLAFDNLKRVGIEDKAYNRATELSGGQQQRVAIARTLMQKPHIILADEPVASLDPATSHSVMKYLKDINQNDGVTILSSLHFLSLAREYSTRVIAMNAGEIVFDGLPSQIDNDKFKSIYGEDAVEVEIK